MPKVGEGREGAEVREREGREGGEVGEGREAAAGLHEGMSRTGYRWRRSRAGERRSPLGAE
jgi:hypothetical protein